jgi:hypothetical protein
MNTQSSAQAVSPLKGGSARKSLSRPFVLPIPKGMVHIVCLEKRDNGRPCRSHLGDIQADIPHTTVFHCRGCRRMIAVTVDPNEFIHQEPLPRTYNPPLSGVVPIFHEAKK